MRIIKSFLQSCLCSNYRRLSFLTIRNLSSNVDDPETLWDGLYRRSVPRTMEEMSVMLGETVDSPLDAHLLKVAIVGVPNCGKSTLINSLMGWRVCSVSSKVHTTRINARAILNQGSTQLIFLDTPGLVSPTEISRHKLERTVLTEAEMSLQNADIIAVIHDMSNRYTFKALNPRVLRLLALYPTIPSVLILNKIDTLKSKRPLLDTTHILTEGIVGGHATHVQKEKREINRNKLIAGEYLSLEERKAILNSEEDVGCSKNSQDECHYTEKDVLEGRVSLTEHQVLDFVKDRKGWPKFHDVFMISGLKEFGVDDLRSYLLSRAYKASWIFSSQVVTDQNPEEIAVMTVREKFLDDFKNEIPYEMTFEIEHWDLTESDLLNIVVRVGCKRKGLAQLVVGYGGRRVSEVAKGAEQELRNTFRTEVRLRLNVIYDASLKKKK